ncbi:hypothetical protein T484DRAFT_1825624 [Baffinella frigidus]|nr:hypothetical protein T484DRAFT_1825624 [Cryptophyta sp. CCMP2293]
MPTARPALVGRQVKRVIDSQWVEVETDKGEQYYANMINGDSRWDMRGDDEKLGGDEENVGRSTKGTGIGISVGQDLAGTALVVEAVVKGSASFRSQRARERVLQAEGTTIALTLRKSRPGSTWNEGDVIEVHLDRRISLTDMTNRTTLADMPSNRSSANTAPGGFDWGSSNTAGGFPPHDQPEQYPLHMTNWSSANTSGGGGLAPHSTNTGGGGFGPHGSADISNRHSSNTTGGSPPHGSEMPNRSTGADLSNRSTANSATPGFAPHDSRPMAGGGFAHHAMTNQSSTNTASAGFSLHGSTGGFAPHGSAAAHHPHHSGMAAGASAAAPPPATANRRASYANGAPLHGSWGGGAAGAGLAWGEEMAAARHGEQRTAAGGWGGEQRTREAALQEARGKLDDERRSVENLVADARARKEAAAAHAIAMEKDVERLEAALQDSGSLRDQLEERVRHLEASCRSQEVSCPA